MPILTKEEALFVLKRACDYKKQRQRKVRKKLVKAQAVALAGLVKQAKMEKKAINPQMLQMILAFGRPLLSGIGKLGRGLGLKFLSRTPTRLATNIGKTVQYGGRGLGGLLNRLGFSGAGSRLLKTFKNPGAMARAGGKLVNPANVGNLGQAARIGRSALGGAETLGFASMFLPPEWLGMGGEQYDYGPQQWAGPQMGPGGHDAQLAAATQEAGYGLPPNPFAAQGGGY